MECEPQFEVPEDPPTISPNLARDCEKWHCGLQSVKVAVCNDGGDDKLCIIKMRNPDAAEPPEDEIDDICERIMQTVQVLGYEETGNHSTYKIQWRVKNSDGKVKRKHTSFDFPGANGLGVRDRDAPSDIQQMYAMERGQTNHVLAVLVTYNENLTARLIDITKTATGQFEPLLKVIDTLVTKYDEGLRMQATSLKEMLRAKYETKTAELEAENQGKMWDTLRSPLKVAAKQFGGKLGDLLDDDDDDDDDDEDEDEIDEDEDDDDDEDEDEDDDADDDGDAESDDLPSTDDDSKSASEKKPERTKKKVAKNKIKVKKGGVKKVKVDPNKRVVGAVDGLLNGFTAQQWFALQKSMSKAQYAKLTEAHGADHDDEAAQAILDMQTLMFSNIPRAKKIRKILTDDQFGALEKLGALSEKHLQDSPTAKKKRKAKKKAAEKRAKKKRAEAKKEKAEVEAEVE